MCLVSNVGRLGTTEPTARGTPLHTRKRLHAPCRPTNPEFARTGHSEECRRQRAGEGQARSHTASRAVRLGPPALRWRSRTTDGPRCGRTQRQGQCIEAARLDRASRRRGRPTRTHGDVVESVASLLGNGPEALHFMRAIVALDIQEHLHVTIRHRVAHGTLSLFSRLQSRQRTWPFAELVPPAPAVSPPG